MAKQQVKALFIGPLGPIQTGLTSKQILHYVVGNFFSCVMREIS
jgi:hypothetical protein